jgi:hypothetical protein
MDNKTTDYETTDYGTTEPLHRKSEIGKAESRKLQTKS